ncbi:lipocalin-like domain-containing protein [Anaeromyxobacter diazotrophicus]|uniref:Carotenoid 1,2-hydratase n=1 Tax=Anaeromyxobacter diazotrophicus TaxID=2590199 RepID=A0A7I9VP48_9BACT|nr:lipocalin-like domain-containing protein [Anaeromyxobacter diazotrophicus]GEJ58183.1 carotenoid 1,2-hydratase [Anaeromyxobacter diazotrophicus]
MRSEPRAALLALLLAAPAATSIATATATATATAATAPSTADGFRPAAPGYAWSFPRDHWKHDGYRTEWWYFTGRLSSVDPPGRELGYQLTFFRVGLLPERPPLDTPWASANLVMVHAAVSDLTGGAHLFGEVLWREMPYLGELAEFPRHPLAWARAAPGTPGRWTLDLAGGAFELAVEDRARGFAYRLRATPERPLVFQGPGGFSRKSAQEGYASLYYSYPRLATEGTVTLGGESWRVRGLSWMDRELGSSQLAPAQVGWDWFALHLADGRDLMLYLLRREDGAVDFARGTLVGPGGATRWLAQGELSVRADRSWRSPGSGATYPARWEVKVPSAGIALTVTPALADQENRSALAGGVFYWEGAVRATGPDGAPAGEGYVELTGYGARSRPPI